MKQKQRRGDKVEEKMSENNTGSGLGIILGILGLVALASYFNKKKCHNCGCENPPEAIICSYCGGRL